MRKHFGDLLTIEVTATAIRLLHTRGWLRTHATILADQVLPQGATENLGLLTHRLRAILTGTQCSGFSTTIILPDMMARLFMVAPPLNSAKLQDYRAAAGLRFQELYGEPPTDWHLDADWNARQPFLACALPRTMLNELQQIAHDHRLTLIGIVPRFVDAWNRWHAKLNATAWFGVVQDNVLTLGVINRQRLDTVRTSAIPATGWDDEQWLPQYLGREALRLNLPMPDQIRLCGSIPGHWTTCTMGSLHCTRLDAGQRVLSNAGAQQ